MESGGSVGYQAAQDTATFIDELAADAAKTVYIVGDIPPAVLNGQTADVTLKAQAAQSTDALGAYVATAGTPALASVETNSDDAGQAGTQDDPNFIDTVFGDPAGPAPGDVAEDGQHSDNDQYVVTTATVTVTKAQTVISDPFNGTTNPKAIPGAVVEYCLDVQNTAPLIAADSIMITDVLGVPATSPITFVPGSIRVDAAGAGAACTSGSGTAEDDDNAGAGDRGDYNVTTADAVTVTVPTIAAGARNKTLFRVTID